MSDDAQTVERSPDSLLGTLAKEMMGLQKEQVGRGPTQAVAHWASPDMLVVVFEDSLTAAEHYLCELHEYGRVRDMRQTVQYSTVPQYCEPVERITGRKVRAFLSGIDPIAGVAIELFMLHPEGFDGPSRGQLHHELHEASNS